MYPLRFINEKLVKIIEACYSGKGVIDGKPSVYLPYLSNPDECRSSDKVRNARLRVTDKKKLRKREKYRPVIPP